MLPQIKKILYATDLKEKGSKNAFRMAVSLAQTNNAQLVVLHVMEPISTSMEGMLRNAMSENEIQQFKTRGQENLRKELVQRVEDFCVEECPNPDKTYPGGDPIIAVVEGESGDVILDQSKKHDVDMIVMGTRTHSGLGQFLLGSTANKVIHHSKVPVLVYPL